MLYSFVLNFSRGWNRQGGGYFSKFSYTWAGGGEGHNKITLGKDRKSTLKMVGEGGEGSENKMER